jgi:hypothetical protein
MLCTPGLAERIIMKKTSFKILQPFYFKIWVSRIGNWLFFWNRFLNLQIILGFFKCEPNFLAHIYVTVNLDHFWTLSEDSQEPKLGGPCTVEDSFEPLGVSITVTWTRPSHLTSQNRIKRMTKKTGVVNILFYSIKLYSTQTPINNSGEIVKSVIWLIKDSFKI